jgi:AraC-like DNA-binding protein/quercetin dioxygenase-like cupin family protein
VPDPFDPHNPRRSEAIVVGTYSLESGEWYEQHTHDQHQLIWARTGVLAVKIDDAEWVLPTSRALWVPAGVPHRTGASTTTEMVSPYLLPARFEVAWDEPTPIVVDDLLGSLISYLATDLELDAREHAERVVRDVLQPAPARPIHLPMPDDDRARDVAEAIIRDPGDQRSLDALARSVGSSRRTMTRLFTDETGMPFHSWRAQARVRASVGLLASGHPVTRTALAVGYSSPSTFAAAFRRVLGTTPSEYAHSARTAAAVRPSVPG